MDSLYGNICINFKISQEIKKIFKDKIEVKNDPLKPNYLEKSAKSVLFSEIIVSIKDEFKKIENLKLLKFLIFIDYYYSRIYGMKRLKKYLKKISIKFIKKISLKIKLLK